MVFDYAGTDGRYLIISDADLTTAIDTENGKTRWAVVEDDPVAGLYLAGDVLVAAYKNGSLRAIDKKSGVTRWSATGFDVLPLTYGANLYMRNGNDGIAAIDAVTGKPEWRAKTAAGVHPFLVSSSVLYAMDERVGSIHLFDRSSGSQVLELERIRSVIVASPSLFGYVRTWRYEGTMLSLLYVLNTAASLPRPELIGTGTEYDRISHIHSRGSRLYIADDVHLHMVDLRRAGTGWEIAILATEVPIEAGGVVNDRTRATFLIQYDKHFGGL